MCAAIITPAILEVVIHDDDKSGAHDHLQEYILSKLVSEKELLAYNAGETPAFEVVTVPCSVVAGDTLQGGTTLSLEGVASPVTRDESQLAGLRMLQQLLGSVPLAHVDDVCDALVFCMERPSMAGRFICAAAYPTFADIVGHFAAKYPHLDVLKE
jgi:nucleoside-diphosphate-sugar epimerase